MELRTTKWSATVASIWIQVSLGAYTFGIISPLLKSTQSYDQSTLDTVALFLDIGVSAGVLSGLLYSFVPSRPWLVHLAGAVQQFAGYFLIWLCVVGVISRPPVAVMCLFMAVASHGRTFFVTANVVTAVRNFPDYSGTIVGIMMGFAGLSGTVLIQATDSVIKDNPSTFVLILALLPVLVSFLFMWFVKFHPISSRPNNNDNDKKHLNGLSLLALALAMYLLALIILENFFTFPSWAQILKILLLLVLLVSPVLSAFKAQNEELSGLPTDEMTLLLTSEIKEPEKFSKNKEMNLLQATCTLDFWLLYIAILCGKGSASALSNNVSQIGQSLGYTSVEIHTLVSLWGIWNFLGRFGAGYVSDIFLYANGWARPLYVVLSLGLMTVGHLIIASDFSGNLYVGTFLVGICYGSLCSLMPTITSELFGVTHMGTIFNAIDIASPVGSFISSVLIIGSIYDREASGEGNSCYGSHCFKSFFVVACGTLLGSLFALVLFFRTRGFYGQILQRYQWHCVNG